MTADVIIDVDCHRVFARLPSYNPFVGTFHHAPSAGNRGAVYFSREIVEMQEIEARKKLRHNPLTGTFHTLPGYYDPLHGLKQFRMNSINNDVKNTPDREEIELTEKVELENQIENDQDGNNDNNNNNKENTVQIENNWNNKDNVHNPTFIYKQKKATSFIRNSFQKKIKNIFNNNNIEKDNVNDNNQYGEPDKEKNETWISHVPNISRTEIKSLTNNNDYNNNNNKEYNQEAPRLPTNPFVARRLSSGNEIHFMTIDRTAPRCHYIHNMNNNYNDDIKNYITSDSCGPYFIHEKEINEKYILDEEEELGDGSYAVVKSGVKRDNSNTVGPKEVAIKQIHKKYLLLNQITKKAVENEVEIHLRLRHKNIVRLYEIYETDDFLYLVMKKADSGTLRNLLNKKPILTEPISAMIFKQIISGVLYLHEHGVLHCDLKPENILLSQKNNYLHNNNNGNLLVEICDFGLAVKVPNVRYYKYTGDVDKVPFTGLIGTSGYIAPELIMKQPYGKQVDMWSLGVLLYEILTGYTPFYPPSACLNEEVPFDDRLWKSYSKEVKDLILNLLVRDPQTRYTAQETLAHPWFDAAAFAL